MEKRDRAILSEFEAGKSFAQLSKRYRLTVSTISAILRQETHRRALSQEAYYRELREHGQSQ